MDTHTAYYLIAGALIVVGLLGTVLPVLPGLPLMFAGMLVAAWADDFQRIGAWSLGIGPRMTIVGADYVRTYFGGTAAGTGGLLQRYNAGVHSVGAIAQATYHWSDKLQTTAYVEYKHLMGDAAKTPIVKTYGDRDSITFGLSASYAFDLGF